MTFTVKHRESDALGGNEYFYTAYDIKVIRKGEHFEDGIYIDPAPPADTRPLPAAISGPMDSQPIPIPCARHVILFGGDQTDAAIQRQGGKVWIMNEGGSTVAAYDL